MGKDRRRATLLIGVLIFSYAAFWSGITSLRHYYFHSGYDLAVHDQVVWNSSQGRLFSRSMEVSNDLADHVRPYLAFLGLLYLALPSAYVLLVFQAFALALAAWPVYVLSKRKFGSPAVGLTIAFCFLAYPPIGFLNRTDFHSEVIAVPLLIAAFERVDAHDLKTAGILMGFSLLAKESVGISVAALGLIVAFNYRYRRFGFMWTSVGLAYSFCALFVVIPAFRGEPSDTLARYQWLGNDLFTMLMALTSNPSLLLDKLITWDNLVTTLQLLAPLGFLPLFNMAVLVAAVPLLIYNYVADYPPQRTIYFHYMAPVIPFLIVAATLGLRRIAGKTEFIQRADAALAIQPGVASGLGAGLAILVAATIASWIYQNPVTSRLPAASKRVPFQTEKSDSFRAGRIVPNDKAIREAIKQAPKDKRLLTTSNYLPHLSHRPQVGSIRHGKVIVLDSDVEALLLNLKDLRRRSCQDHFENLRLAKRSGFGVTFYREGAVLVEKGRGSVVILDDLLADWPGCS
jgi:uncharacterized membrane protein